MKGGKHQTKMSGYVDSYNDTKGTGTNSGMPKMMQIKRLCRENRQNVAAKGGEVEIIRTEGEK